MFSLEKTLNKKFNRTEITNLIEFLDTVNYGNLYTSNWGGFQGYLSNLRYFNFAIQPYLVDQIFNSGPSKTFASNISQGLTDPSATLAPNYWMTVGYPNMTSIPGYNQNPSTST
jgi:hypothetical protein